MAHHAVLVDGVFEAVSREGDADTDTDVQACAPGFIFHPASAIDAPAVAQAQTTLRRRIMRAFVSRGLLESCDAKDMLGYQSARRRQNACFLAEDCLFSLFCGRS